eukprot:7395529-Alexandrium_andersonii.AAC.1
MEVAGAGAGALAGRVWLEARMEVRCDAPGLRLLQRGRGCLPPACPAGGARALPPDAGAVGSGMGGPPAGKPPVVARPGAARERHLPQA